MGVPVFFRWLCARNPKIIQDAIQPEFQSFDSGNPLIDHFYIDMNGLIHPSCNPKGENIKIPKNFEQQCQNIYEYIDKIMNIVRPKKTLYLAIDGVAPRAKMNQQRSRRFRAAMDSSGNSEKKLQLLDKFKKIGAWTEQVQDYAHRKNFDSNVITPGTQFLHGVCIKLRQYIQDRLQNHKLWKDLVVIFSDANCPGEGQHKIMDYIRQARASKGYRPYQSHCIYGADADLIMLALATHQPKFYVIREIVITANDKFCTNCQKRGHFFMDCQSAVSIEDEARVTRQMNASSINVDFQFIRIQMVRQFIHINFMRSTIAFQYNLQRVIDDFIFLCFFVGNDFLPHVPCLSIRDGGVDVLLKVYEYCLSIMPDYITYSGKINLKSLQIFIEEMSQHQQSLVEQMINKQSGAKQRQMNNRMQQERQKAHQKGKNRIEDEDEIDPLDPLGSFINEYKKITREQPLNLDEYSVFGHNLYSYKEKYYKQKFKITAAQFMELKNNLSRSYFEALQWICGYYYQGVQSWEWFYPFHYSPFFTDLVIPQQQITFTKGIPFKPFQQLMAVLPAGTSVALPEFLRWYMSNIDSPIIDFFPSNFVVDLVGKKFSWLGEVILPFLDEKRLLEAMGDYEQKLTQQERHRNRYGIVNVYLYKNSPLGTKISKANVGETLNVSFGEYHGIQGDLTVLNKYKQTIEYCYEQPFGRAHQICLKQGKQFDPLAQINDQFISRTDRAAFGGQRFIRIIQRSLGKRRNEKRSDNRRHRQKSPQNQPQSNNNNNNNYNNRERSRQKNKSHYSNQYKNSRQNQR